MERVLIVKQILGSCFTRSQANVFKELPIASKTWPGLSYSYGNWEGTMAKHGGKILGLTHRGKIQIASVRDLWFATLLFVIYSSR